MSWQKAMVRAVAVSAFTLWQYVSSSMSFTLAAVFQKYWLVGLVLVGLVFLGSVMFERFHARR